MGTVASPVDLARIPVLDEDDVCHLVLDKAGSQTWCGAPSDCPKSWDKQWSGQSHCSECGRLVCPECVALGDAEAR